MLQSFSASLYTSRNIVLHVIIPGEFWNERLYSPIRSRIGPTEGRIEP